ncbi:hypothetical protein ACWEOW_10210 [Monashia sp. NPDC004114]
MSRARVELVTALIFGAAAIATLVWPTWIEEVTPFEPDEGSGEAEWWVVATLGLVALVALIMSITHFRAQRRLRSARAEG